MKCWKSLPITNQSQLVTLCINFGPPFTCRNMGKWYRPRARTRRPDYGRCTQSPPRHLLPLPYSSTKRDWNVWYGNLTLHCRLSHRVIFPLVHRPLWHCDHRDFWRITLGAASWHTACRCWPAHIKSILETAAESEWGRVDELSLVPKFTNTNLQLPYCVFQNFRNIGMET